MNGNFKPSEQIAALIAQGQHEQAARVAHEAGMIDQSVELYERACCFEKAAEVALAADDGKRALLLAVLAGGEDLVRRAVDAVSREPQQARAAAELLRARGHEYIAAKLYDRVGDPLEAARLYASSGHALEAVAAFERANQPVQGVRALEAAYRADPRDEEIVLALGERLVEHRRYEAAARILQNVGSSSPHRARALPLLFACFEALGLSEPLEELRTEATKAGVPLDGSGGSSTGASEGCANGVTGPTQVVYGRYEIHRLVATTHAARVFEAVDRLTTKRVAVKQLLASNLLGAGRDALSRLAREARALEQLRHPNVVPLVELVGGGEAIVTPWMAGGSLADLMARGPIAPARCVEIAGAILGALAEAHRLGILHRDVKPSNILFDEAGVPMLADFGAAHLSDASVTATAGVIGTLAYMSPEQRLGQPATPASDIYGVGASLLEILTGTLSPIGTGETPTLSRIIPDLNSGHDAVLAEMLAEQPSNRFEDALVARDALLRLWWPAEVRAVPPVVALPPAPEKDKTGRVRHLHGKVAQDGWLHREVLLVESSETMLRVAQAYAAASSDSLCVVLRVDSARQEIWFEIPRGDNLALSHRTLTEEQRAMLRKALVSLHAQGISHGCVHAKHIVLRDGFPVLVIEPDTVATGDPDQDLRDLQTVE